MSTFQLPKSVHSSPLQYSPLQSNVSFSFSFSFSLSFSFYRIGFNKKKKKKGIINFFFFYVKKRRDDTFFHIKHDNCLY